MPSGADLGWVTSGSKSQDSRLGSVHGNAVGGELSKQSSASIVHSAEFGGGSEALAGGARRWGVRSFPLLISALR